MLHYDIEGWEQSLRDYLAVVVEKGAGGKSKVKMIGIFERKKRTAAELVQQTRHLLLQLDATSWDSKQDDKVELAKNIREMKSILYGSTEADPNPEMCAQLSQEVFKDNAMRLLIQAIPRLDLEARKDITQVVANLQRQQVNSRRIAADYLATNTDLLDLMVLGYENLELALHYGTMLRECIRHQVTAKYVLESDKFINFFTYIELPNFDIASNAATTFAELLTRHKSAVAEFLTKNYDWFFLGFNKLLESHNYITKWQSVKLLGDILFDRSNVKVMMRYVSCTDNLRILMNLLKEPSKNIQVEAFHVFKIFVANTSKPPEIVSILMANREKLLNLLGEFTVEKEDVQLHQDIPQVMREIEGLE